MPRPETEAAVVTPQSETGDVGAEVQGLPAGVGNDTGGEGQPPEGTVPTPAEQKVTFEELGLDPSEMPESLRKRVENGTLKTVADVIKSYAEADKKLNLDMQETAHSRKTAAAESVRADRAEAALKALTGVAPTGGNDGNAAQPRLVRGTPEYQAFNAELSERILTDPAGWAGELIAGLKRDWKQMLESDPTRGELIKEVSDRTLKLDCKELRDLYPEGKTGIVPFKAVEEQVITIARDRKLTGTAGLREAYAIAILDLQEQAHAAIHDEAVETTHKNILRKQDVTPLGGGAAAIKTSGDEDSDEGIKTGIRDAKVNGIPWR